MGGRILDNNNSLITHTNTQDILQDMRGIIETTQENAYHAVNVTLVKRSWLLGHGIAEEELKTAAAARNMVWRLSKPCPKA